MAQHAQSGERVDGLLERMRRFIADGEFPPGSRLPPTRALAERLQVSRATVGELLRRLEAEGAVIAGSERIRFVAGAGAPAAEPARPLPAGTVAILSGLPLDYPMATTFPFVHRIHAALSRGLLAAGLNPFLMVGGAEQARRAAALRPTACVVLDDAFGREPDFQSCLDPLRDAAIPLAVQSDRLPDALAAALAVDAVRCDHRAGAAALVRVLAERGRRRLIATFPEHLAGAQYWTVERAAGIHEGCAALGLPPPAVVRLPLLEETGDADLRFARMARVAAGFLLEHLHGGAPADALLIASDGEVAPAAAACRLLGRTPGGDIDLVGYDDYWRGIPERRYESYAPVASIDRDGTAVGLALAEAVAGRLADRGGQARVHRVAPRLVTGDAIDQPRPDGGTRA